MIVTAENLGALAKEMAVNMPQEDVANEVAVENTEDPSAGGVNLFWSFEFVSSAGTGIFHTFLTWVGVILSAFWIVFSKYESAVAENMWTAHFANDCSIFFLDHGMMSGDISAHPSYEWDTLVFFMTIIRWDYLGLAMCLLFELRTKRKTYLKIWALLMFTLLVTVWSALLIQPLFKEMSNDGIFCVLLVQVFMTFHWAVVLFFIRGLKQKLVVGLTIV